MPRILAVCVLFTAMLTLQAEGAQLEFSPYITSGIHYSDNITLQPENMAQKDTVLEITPGFSLSYPGRSFTADIQYHAQSLFYNKYSDQNEVYNHLIASMTAMADDQFFLDLNSDIYQQVVDPEQPVATSNIPVTGNRTEGNRNSVNPHWDYVSGNGMRTGLGYAYTDIAYDQQVPGSLENSDVKTKNAYIGRKVQDMLWMLSYRSSEAEYAGGNNSRFENVNLEIRFPVGGRTSLITTVGKEDNIYETATGAEPPEGSFWTVGAQWVNPDTSRIEMSAGKRFFGDTYHLLLERRGHYLQTELSYEEELLTDNQLAQGSEVLSGRISPTTNLDRLTTDVYLSKRIEWQVSYRRSKTDISFIAGNRKREFQSDGSQDTTRDGRLIFKWNVAPRLALVLDGLRSDSEFRGTDREDRLIESRFGLERQVSTKTNFGMYLRNSRRSSNNPLAEYRERGVDINITRYF